MFTLGRSGAEGAVWTLAEGRQMVGRAEDCDLRLDDVRVSRHHAEVRVSGPRVSVRDLGSSNGVFVNGSKVTQADLSPGDRVRFGPVEFVLHDASFRPPPRASPHEDTVLLEQCRVDGAALPSDSRRLQALYQVAEGLVSNLRRQELLPRVLDALAELFRYDRCAIASRDSRGEFSPLASRPEGAGAAFSHTVAEKVAREAQALLFQDIQGQAGFDLSESVMGLNIRSVLCAPLLARGEVTGLVYLDRSLPSAYDAEDLALLQGVAAMVAVALENAELYAEAEGRYEQTAEQLRVLEARLIETERAAALGQLALAVADAVRNPVMVIGGLARRLGRANPAGELSSLAGTIQGEADRLEDTMRRVDALVSLPEAKVAGTDVGEVARAAAERAREKLASKQIALRIEWGEATARARHDPQLTGIALEALLNYFGRWAPPGGGLHLAGPWFDEASVVLQIEDERCAGQPLELRGVFEVRASKEPWSLDLDLALAERAMVAQGGDVKVGARSDGGIRVHLVLPRYFGNVRRTS